jgi:hypothetical protein
MNTRFLQFALMLSALTFAVGCGGPVAEEADQMEENPEVVMVNTVCPIMGDAVMDKFTTTWNGKTIGFCCIECEPKWNELSDEEKSEKLASAGKEADGENDKGDGHKGHSDGAE